MIRDAAGTPLPDELQAESELWLAVFDSRIGEGRPSSDAVYAADEAMVALAGVMYPK